MLSRPLAASSFAMGCMLMFAASPLVHATPPDPTVTLDGASFQVQFQPFSGPTTAAGETPDGTEPRVIAGRTHYRWGTDTKSRALPFTVRNWNIVATGSGESALTVLCESRGATSTGTCARVDAAGKHVLFKLPTPPAPDRFAICANQYLVGVATYGTTIVHDLKAQRLVGRDGEAGVHARADFYGGPSCSPDGRFVAVPDTRAAAVFFFRLADGARVARVDVPAPEGYVPAFVTWQQAPDALIRVQLAPDPVATNPPK